MYNIRVYGLVINNEAVLVSDELYNGIYMTKFPGGGHQPGESLTDCLRREFKEELNVDIVVNEHFYTTDFYVPSFFNKNHQLLSIYYHTQIIELNKVRISKEPFNFEPVHGAQSLRWILLSEITEEDLTYIIDKKVVTMLKKSYNL